MVGYKITTKFLLFGNVILNKRNLTNHTKTLLLLVRNIDEHFKMFVTAN